MTRLEPESPVDLSDVAHIWNHLLNGHDLDLSLRQKVGDLYIDHVMVPTIRKMIDNHVDLTAVAELLVREFNLGVEVSFSDPLSSRKALSGSPSEKPMDLGALFAQLEEIREISARTEKEEILEEIMSGPNAEAFRFICHFVFNSFRHVNVKVTSSMIDDVHCVEQLPDDRIWNLFVYLLDLMEQGKLVGGGARKSIVEFLSACDDDYVEWFAMILNKKFKIGVGRSTIEKFIPDIPKFSVQLCKRYKGWQLLRPYMVQPKVDGLRAVVGKLGEERVALSRNGKPLYNVDVIVDLCGELCSMLGGEYILDGEFWAGNWADSISIARRSKRKHATPEQLKFYVFDIIPLHEWVRCRCESPLVERDALLQVAVETLDNPRIVCLPSIISSDAEEIEMIASTFAEEGWEGAVLKDPSSYYSYGRDDSWLKFKFVEEADVEVVGVKYGWYNASTGSIIDDDDPRAADMSDGWQPIVRSLIINYCGVDTSVGSGLELSQRIEFYALVQKGGLIGGIVEVEYQSVTPDGRLLFPRFRRLRLDKST